MPEFHFFYNRFLIDFIVDKQTPISGAMDKLFGPRTLHVLPQPNLMHPNTAIQKLLAIEIMRVGCGSTIHNYYINY